MLRRPTRADTRWVREYEENHRRLRESAEARRRREDEAPGEPPCNVEIRQAEAERIAERERRQAEWDAGTRDRNREAKIAYERAVAWRDRFEELAAKRADGEATRLLAASLERALNGEPYERTFERAAVAILLPQGFRVIKDRGLIQEVARKRWPNSGHSIRVDRV